MKLSSASNFSYCCSLFGLDLNGEDEGEGGGDGGGVWTTSA